MPPALPSPFTCISGEDVSICKGGTVVTDCPTPAICAFGRILSCDVPYNKVADGAGCVLNAAANEEVKTVVNALR